MSLFLSIELSNVQYGMRNEHVSRYSGGRNGAQPTADDDTRLGPEGGPSASLSLPLTVIETWSATVSVTYQLTTNNKSPKPDPSCDE